MKPCHWPSTFTRLTVPFVYQACVGKQYQVAGKTDNLGSSVLHFTPGCHRYGEPDVTEDVWSVCYYLKPVVTSPISFWRQVFFKPILYHSWHYSRRKSQSLREEWMMLYVVPFVVELFTLQFDHFRYMFDADRDGIRDPIHSKWKWMLWHWAVSWPLL